MQKLNTVFKKDSSSSLELEKEKSQPSLAIFDLDETLIAADSASLWNNFLVDKNLAPQSLIEKEQALMQAYSTGEMNMYTYMEITLTPIIGKTIREVDKLVFEFVQEKIIPIIYKDAQQRIIWHQNRGDKIIIVSATGEHLVRAIAMTFGVNDVLAIQVASQYGVYTGKTFGVLSYKEGKVTRIKDWLKEQKTNFKEMYGYSDSCNDIHLLDFSDKAFVINPDPKLTKHATGKKWTILNWS